jgi:hypothetical protein
MVQWLQSRRDAAEQQDGVLRMFRLQLRLRL